MTHDIVIPDALPSGTTIKRSNRGGFGLQVLLHFPNGRGLSVVTGLGTYGVEAAVLNADDEIDYSTPITDDVLGYLSPDDLRRTIEQVAALPSIAGEVE